MKERPKDFFGPDDYFGGDVDEYVDAIEEAQHEWDLAFAALPWWRKLLFHLGFC